MPKAEAVSLTSSSQDLEFAHKLAELDVSHVFGHFHFEHCFHMTVENLLPVDHVRENYSGRCAANRPAESFYKPPEIARADQAPA